MAKHPFRVAIEAGAKDSDIAELLSPEAVLFAPMLSKPVIGAAPVLKVIAAAARIAGPLHYTHEVSDSKQTILLWRGQVEGFNLEAATILVDDAGGLIREVRVLMRPWPVVSLFRNAMYESLSESIPKDFWELGPQRHEDEAARRFTPIALKEIPWAPNVELHSPTLARAVSGKAGVDQAVDLAHEVQSRSSYTSIIATPELIIELFDCDADGYPMEGMWIQKVNEQGQIFDLTVMLRPYPAVTVLRNKTKALAEQRGVLGPEYWELPGR
jgi:hypothetical protein